MKKHLSNKLALSRETLRQLDTSSVGIAGARPPLTKSMCATECVQSAGCPTQDPRLVTC